MAAKAAGWKKPDGNRWYPPNDGFHGAPTRKKLAVGTKLDRYGGEHGRILARNCASYEGRASPPGTDKLAPYHQYEVTKRIAVKSGPATPWFDEVGKGAQYETEKSVEQLIALGCLMRIS
ncbi:TNT domain-containing protein [Massilia sp. H6]|uniref:TNT domain-containing protein n=1 Tax=Massilia sp. H6 TaxID=2970464 RepID=UPI00216A4997|nr:TNT domain-containing protein [Massilia sp. H6]UVW27051.1 TNT domain-containing protein [Massilia sp. H6]